MARPPIREHAVRVETGDYGSVEVAVVSSRIGRAIWLTMLGRRGGRLTTMHLTPRAAGELARRLRQAAEAAA